MTFDEWWRALAPAGKPSGDGEEQARAAWDAREAEPGRLRAENARLFAGYAWMRDALEDIAKKDRSFAGFVAAEALRRTTPIHVDASDGHGDGVDKCCACDAERLEERHCWHLAPWQHSVGGHRDDMCCRCATKRCVSVYPRCAWPDDAGIQYGNGCADFARRRNIGSDP